MKNIAVKVGWLSMKSIQPFIPWSSKNDESEDAFYAALEERGVADETCLICQEHLDETALVCYNCEDEYSWANGPLGEGFYHDSIGLADERGDSSEQPLT